MEQTRRRFLAASAALGSGALAGCSAVSDAIPFIGGGGLGDYEQWVYEPDRFASADESGEFGDDSVALSIFAINQQSIYENREELYPSTYSSLSRNFVSNTGILPRNVSMVLNLPEGVVLSGSFERGEVTAELEADTSTEYESDGSHEGYDLYVRAEREESPDAFGVADGTVVQGQRVDNFGSDADSVPATDVVEGIIDTNSGGATRYVNANDAFGTLVSSLSGSSFLTATVRSDPIGSDEADENSGEFEGLVASGQASTINGATTDSQSVFVFDSQSDADTGAVTDYVEYNDNEGQFARARNVEVSQSGRTITVTATADTYTAPNLGSGTE
ncbi:hypothetical protein SAMN05216388_1004279 [Halorientalis persicus]|jgi:hypothetical protein|uniref:Uncharacterized protein n=1 Tax=Halorientalis persicus TaxID=1367881 RepID=A0A1H8IVH1_9EURY|nr:hypothetical protein [Halorientalis persicus]SEN72145.1 hypothetical protein SAMN05216388_1004279 [Halorientalis persicus]